MLILQSLSLSFLSPVSQGSREIKVILTRCQIAVCHRAQQNLQATIINKGGKVFAKPSSVSSTLNTPSPSHWFDNSSAERLLWLVLGRMGSVGVRGCKVFVSWVGRMWGCRRLYNWQTTPTGNLYHTDLERELERMESQGVKENVKLIVIQLSNSEISLLCCA